MSEASDAATIWIDLDNTPHVPFFRPVIRELEGRGHRVVVTARDAYQVLELADEMGLPYTPIGRHWGGNIAMKAIGLAWRTIELIPFCLRNRPDVALSHGSRAQVLLCKALGVPTIVVDDYEGSTSIPCGESKWLIVPDALDGLVGRSRAPGRVKTYRGLKEDVYAPDFDPDPSMLDELGLTATDAIVTVRPPADEAHYRDARSDALLEAVMSRICETPGFRGVFLPRNSRQDARLREAHPDWFSDGRVIVPAHVLDGLNLVWYSDFVISGGGTMNREAAALGVPVFSIFGGRVGAVDRMLERDGRLTIVRTADEVRTSITFDRRDKSGRPDKSPRPALADILGHVDEIIRVERGGA